MRYTVIIIFRRNYMKSQKSVSEIINLTTTLMKKQGYTESSINRICHVMEQLADYSLAHNIQNYSVKLTTDYLRDEYGYIEGISKGRLTAENLQLQKYVLMMTQNVYLHNTLVHTVSRTREPCVDFYAEIQKRYIKYCSIDNHSERCVKNYLRISCEFLSYLEDNNHTDFSDIDDAIIDRFILSLECYTKHTVKLKLRSFKVFLRYLYDENYIDTDYSYRVPKVTIYQKGHIPSTLSKKECKRLLENIDLKNPVGMRDFAVILTAMELGLRESDICNLTVDNFDWDEKRLTLIQEKTLKPASFPISDELINAIGNYMKNGRPKVKSPYIFLTHRFPYKKLSGMYDTMRRALEAAGIKRSKEQSGGMHLLRHTFASNLLENGVCLSTISELLGHRDYRSTEVYLHTDIESLRRCTLELEKS